MKQIVDKLNKIAKKINENVELSDRDLIIDSLDSITKAYGGTPNDSTLIVDKLEDIYNNISPAVSGNIEITENTAEGESLNIAQYATATVNVSGGGGGSPYCTVTIVNTDSVPLSLGKYIDPEDLNVKTSVDLQPNDTLDITGFYHDIGSDTYTVLIQSNLSQGAFQYLVSANNTLFSNPVNITITEVEDGVYAPIVNDPTQPSSLTIDWDIMPK